MDQAKYLAERDRVQEAERIVSRLSAIQQTLDKLNGYTELHVGSENNCGFRPQIRVDEIRRFVQDTYDKERKELERLLNILYPEVVRQP